jgi:hypothetical protein
MILTFVIVYTPLSSPNTPPFYGAVLQIYCVHPLSSVVKKCRYLRKDDEEDIDLSTVVTLASEQLKNKQGLKYKPLFKKQKSKKNY